MSNKAKGTKYENKLFDKLNDRGYKVLRAAGSGTKREADVDLIAGNHLTGQYGIECKFKSKKYIYISKEQMSNFIDFCEVFGLIPKIAARFPRMKWYFLDPEQLEETGKNFKVTQDMCKREGEKIDEVFE
ncbi:MAG: Holliday junction resolvase Hjc [archaeon]